MDIKQTQKLSQRITLTPQMKQSLYILQLPLLKLKSYLETQMEENPVLEYEPEILEEPLSEEIIQKFIELNGKNTEDIDSYSSIQSSENLRKKKDYQESLIVRHPSLHDYLLRQLRLYRMKNKDYKIGEFIILNIDENGYLQVSLEEIIGLLNKNKTFKKEAATKSEAEKILKLIQTFEPIGIGARNLKECLFIQLKAKKTQNSIIYKIVENYLSELAKNRMKFIARKLKVSLDKIEKAAKKISTLEPRPGRALSQEKSRNVTPVNPDVLIEKIENKYRVIINNQNLPSIRINPRYRNLLKSDKTSKDTKRYLRQKISSALWLTKTLSQRNETIRRITECMLNIQKDFFKQGDISSLKPLTHKKIARMAERNESTVSRVVTNKHVKTPYGTFKLSYFFSAHLNTIQGEKISTENIKSLIFDLVSEENRHNPLNDNTITKILSRQGIKIARRTVAKYREKLKIPSRSHRKSIKR